MQLSKLKRQQNARYIKFQIEFSNAAVAFCFIDGNSNAFCALSRWCLMLPILSECRLSMKGRTSKPNNMSYTLGGVKQRRTFNIGKMRVN